MVTSDINALVWSEGTEPEEIYPDGIRGAVASALADRGGIETRTRSLDDEGQGASAADLDWADAVVWWGHLRHDDVTDRTVDRIEEAVTEEGVGFVSLHSAHYARPYKRLIGTSGDLGEVRLVDGERERVGVEAPDHPVADGVDDFVIDGVEMFGEPYDIPDPETVVFESEFSEGGWFRSGVAFRFGAGAGFYLRPGHEEFPIYRDHDEVRRALANAVEWVAADG
ncbi:ThuA domain-containing protein [Candidatus Halobonum tyrrellensis]|uniref:ThuA domain-containing protein n=1 Tax=Candidatus Halobonum tyrrellensis TaxID=1431545 RepID=UPI0006778E50|nr:ThuA domain-containing protein [Candidatus Halobonum tyrrellensis]